MGLSSPATLSVRALAWLLCHLPPGLPDMSFVPLSQQIFLQLETLRSEGSPEQVPLQQEELGHPERKVGSPLLTRKARERWQKLLLHSGRSFSPHWCEPEDDGQYWLWNAFYFFRIGSKPCCALHLPKYTQGKGISQNTFKSLQTPPLGPGAQQSSCKNTHESSSWPITESQMGWGWKGPQ